MRLDAQPGRVGLLLQSSVSLQTCRNQAELAGGQIHRMSDRFESQAGRDHPATICSCRGFRFSAGAGFHFHRFDVEQRVIHQRPDSGLHCRRTGFEPSAGSKSLKSMLASDWATCNSRGLPSRPDAVPVEHAIGRVRILLDFKNHQAGADGMDAAARQKHRVARAHRNAMKTFRHVCRFGFFSQIPRA